MGEAAAEQGDGRENERRKADDQNKFQRSIYGVPLTVTVSIGQRKMSVSDLLMLQADSIVPLTTRIDDPIDLTVNDKVIARGELIESDDGTIAVKLTEIGGLSDD